MCKSMSHKLRDIFSENEPLYNFRIKFNNRELNEQFREALDEVFNEGKSSNIEGKAEIYATIENGDREYPVWESNGENSITLNPEIKDIQFPLSTETGDKILVLKVCQIKDGLLLQSDEDEIIYIRILVNKETLGLNLELRLQPTIAKSINDIIERYCIIKTFLEQLIDDTNKNGKENSLEALKEHLDMDLYFYRMVISLENVLKVSFVPSEMARETDDLMIFYELYYLLVRHKVVRINGKVTINSSNDFIVTGDIPAEIGMPLEITFYDELSEHLWGCDISIYTANYLGNAVIKEIYVLEDNQKKIVYNGDDVRPLYISFKGFCHEEEAKEECTQIIDHKELYIEAKTVGEYLEQDNLIF